MSHECGEEAFIDDVTAELLVVCELPKGHVAFHRDTMTLNDGRRITLMWSIATPEGVEAL